MRRLLVLACVLLAVAGLGMSRQCNVSTHLHKGLNWVSLPCDCVHNRLPMVFKGVWDKVEAVYVYKGGQWTTYHASAPDWANSLCNVPRDRTGFVVKVSEDCDWSVVGLPRSENQRKTLLYRGANLIGVERAQPVWQALAGVPFRRVFTGDGVELELGDTMEPGKGYWVYVVRDCIWP